jgi:carboxymethylenebutenolidase
MSGAVSEPGDGPSCAQYDADPMTEFEELSAGDVTVRAYISIPADARAGVVVLHPWWGLNDDVVAYADRLAGDGFAVVAPDLFDGQVATTIEDAERLARGADADEARIGAITLVAHDHLAERIGPDGKLAALGFSFGAHWAMWSPTQRERVVASVIYYGTTGDALAEASVPVLGHFAEDDPYETEEWVAEFESILKSAGRDVTIHRYPGTGHWFAEPSRDAYRPEAAELAFERTVTFLQQRFEPPDGSAGVVRSPGSA